MVLIIGIFLCFVTLKIISSHIIVDKESTLKSAEQELLRVDMPEDQKRSRKPKRLYYDEDEDSSPSEIPRKVIEQLYNAQAVETRSQ